ncbi:hypothetical protein SEUCBS140593_007227 [Sporothrix eucalyptigena]|uniref:Alpha/beta hydrolase fold-3 domain-containing protein n=1 Tax=Sporothrix eucalyptigena TaxID=1812306 RepID=A0ABP0CBJ0_9PEZI
MSPPALRYNTEFLALAGPALDEQREVLPAHDIVNRRARVEAFIRNASGAFTLPNHIGHKVYHTTSKDGHQVAIHHVWKKAVTGDKQPAVLHIHGGGYICLGAVDSVPSLASFVDMTGVPMLSVDYRLAPEAAYPLPLDDCWAALEWVQSNATSLQIDPARIAVMGESAGGGLAAGLVLLARDRKFSPPVAKQILVYPMLDDRTVEDPTDGLAVFHINDVLTGWKAYLGKLYEKDDVPAYAAAARVSDISGLPPLYLDVGQLDLFLREDFAYVQKFVEANLPVEFHIYEGVPHAFQRFAPASRVAKQAVANRCNAMLDF